MKGFAPIDYTEQYAEVSDLSNNLSSMYLRNSGNSGGVKRYSITKDHTYMIYDFIQDRKHYCIVDIFVPSMERDTFTPNVMPGGNMLSIEMVSPKFFFQYDRLKMANMRNVGFNENSHKATAFEQALRDMRRELKVKKGGEVSGEDMIIPLPFRCDQHIVRWGLLSFENKDREVMDKHNPDVQMNDILSLTLLSEEKMESDEEEEGEVLFLSHQLGEEGQKYSVLLLKK